MNQQSKPTPHVQPRVDTHLARVVDIGLGYKTRLGYPHAKAYLREQGVPPEIVNRVLSSSGPVRLLDAPDND